MLLVIITLFVASAFSDTLTVWFLGYNSVYSPIATVVSNFEKAYPNIHVDISYKPVATVGAAPALITAIQAGNPPDVVVDFDRFTLPTWAAEGYLMPLDKYIKENNVSLNAFIPYAIQSSMYDGKIYGLPMEVSARVMMYSIPLLKKFGIPFPSASTPLTWSQYKQYLIKTTTIDPQTGFYKTLGCDYLGDEEQWFSTWAVLAGVNFYDETTRKFTFDSPAGLQVMDMYKWLSDEFPPTKVSGFMGAFPGVNVAFAEGKLAFFLSGAWNLSWFDSIGFKYGIDYGLAPLPVPTAGMPIATWSGGHATVIPVGSKNISDAFKFAEYMSIGPGAVYYDKASANIPAVKSEAMIMYKDDPAMLYFLKQILNYGHLRLPTVPTKAQLWDTLASAVSKVEYGKLTPQAALEWAQQQSQKDLDQFYAIH